MGDALAMRRHRLMALVDAFPHLLVRYHSPERRPVPYPRISILVGSTSITQ